MTSIGALARNAHAGRSPSARISLWRLVPALACGFLPIFLTGVLFVLLGSTGVQVPPWMQGLPLIFTLYTVANVVVVALVFVILGRQRLRELGLFIEFTRRKVWLASAALLIGIAIFGIVNWTLRQFGLPVVRGVPSSVTGAQMLLLFVTVGIVVPFCEELLFRTVWYMGLLQRVPALVAGTLSAAAFAAIHIPHFGLGGMIFISFWTLLPLGLYAHTRDITAPWLMHALNNTFAYVVVPAIGVAVPGSG